jgi:hypothetical protein
MSEVKRQPWYSGYVVPGVVLIVAAALLALASAYHWHEFFTHLFTAFVIAGALGLSVDWWLKKELQRNVAEAIAGHPLPPGMLQELYRIYDNKVVCIAHMQEMSIEPLPDGERVRITVLTDRTLENFGRQNFVPIKLEIDEWFSGSDVSTIDLYEYEYLGRRHVIEVQEETKKRNCGWGLLSVPPIRLKRREKVRIWHQYSEIKRREDAHYIQFGSATIEPSVKIRLPDEFDYIVGFAHPEEPIVEPTTKTHKLPAVLLPNGPIRVHWWEKEKNNMFLTN